MYTHMIYMPYLRHGDVFSLFRATDMVPRMGHAGMILRCSRGSNQNSPWHHGIPNRL